MEQIFLNELSRLLKGKKKVDTKNTKNTITSEFLILFIYI